MASTTSPSSSPEPSSDSMVSGLKRRIASLQQEVDDARGSSNTKKNQSPMNLGRGIRRLVTLFEPIDNLFIEADFRLRVEQHGSQVPEPITAEDIEAKIASDRTYRGYVLLLRLLPEFRALLADPDVGGKEIDRYTALLTKGAGDARSDDVRRIKEELSQWLNTDFSPPVPFLMKSRVDRGLQNDITGRLLCPIEHNWKDEKVRASIQSGELNISDDVFLACFYPNGNGSDDNVELGFLRSALLVKTYCAIFTSPTSSYAFEEEEECADDSDLARKKQKTDVQKKATKANVATLLHMDNTVTPRSIAYAAVLLVLNLTDAAQWNEVYDNFSFSVLYNFVVDYFENTPTEAAKSNANNLLKWWNRQVFPHKAVAVASSRKSRDKLAAQRARAVHASE